MIGLALYAGSLISGWLAFWPWPIVPPVVMAVFAWRMRRRLQRKMLDTFGRDTIRSPHAQDMLLRSEISLVSKTAVINAALFALAYGVQLLI